MALNGWMVSARRIFPAVLVLRMTTVLVLAVLFTGHVTSNHSISLSLRFLAFKMVLMGSSKS